MQDSRLLRGVLDGETAPEHTAGVYLYPSTRWRHTCAPAHDWGILMRQHTNGVYYAPLRPSGEDSTDLGRTEVAGEDAGSPSTARAGSPRRQCPEQGFPRTGSPRTRSRCSDRRARGSARGERTESSGPGSEPRLPAGGLSETVRGSPRAQGPAYSRRHNRAPPGQASGPLLPAARGPARGPGSGRRARDGRRGSVSRATGPEPRGSRALVTSGR